MENSYVAQMDAILREKAKSGTTGIRLFVPDSRDINAEDVAYDFCEFEKARREGNVIVRKSLGF